MARVPYTSKRKVEIMVMPIRCVKTGLFALALASTACKGADGSGRAAPSGPTAAPAPPAAGAPHKSLPDKGPWDAARITYWKDDPTDGSPKFKLENLGSKTIEVCFIDFYGYDATGKQIAKKELSWNGSLKGGETDGSVDTKKIDGVKTWEATYHGIRLEGDKDPTMDYARAPTNRAMGGSATAPAGTAGSGSDATPSAAAGSEDYGGLTGSWITDWGAVKLDGGPNVQRYLRWRRRPLRIQPNRAA
ncbi:MAG: hypothetical protein U0263_06160 [Polyangiaceae bacterium]